MQKLYENFLKKRNVFSETAYKAHKSLFETTRRKSKKTTTHKRYSNSNIILRKDGLLLPLFTYAKAWKLLNLFVGTKIFNYYICYETNRVLIPFSTTTEQYMSKDD